MQNKDVWSCESEPFTRKIIISLESVKEYPLADPVYWKGDQLVLGRSYSGCRRGVDSPILRMRLIGKLATEG